MSQPDPAQPPIDAQTSVMRKFSMRNLLILAAVTLASQPATWVPYIGKITGVWQHNLKSEKYSEAKKMLRLSVKNTQCIQNHKPDTVKTLADGKTMQVTICPSGDILRVESGPLPSSPRQTSWFGRSERRDVLKVLEKKSFFNASSLHAAPRPRIMRPVKLICRKVKGDYEYTVSKWSNGKCYRYRRNLHHRRYEFMGQTICDPSRCDQ